ncbi:hypothetical protein GF1_17120 [Desulfolithobacter dissulfuricans]|uniref:Uncharacterized protein n=1 Tax=Desulfolithobacter dissulfuricans TaxID=2795293 RepID=A0A915U9V7_9BACT|nr:hypothetical protein [Desulfolithobacter dissulfuricans]BCO09336.1 hypothetical protein GF1_17120 [Desulfolithobacter dissulfuricans]
MSNKIFDRKEIEDKSGPHLQQVSQQIKQRFDQKRAFYHQLRNQYFIFDYWNELNRKIVEFDQKFNVWNQKWANIQRSNNAQQLIQYFEEGEKIYSEIDEFVESIVQRYKHSPDVEALKKEILHNIESDILRLKTEISSQVEKGIKNVLDLKAELGLQKNFQGNIEEELKKSVRHRNWFMAGFIISLMFIPFFVFSTFAMEYFKQYGEIERYVLRFGVAISVGFLSYFFYGQYRLYQLISLRYSHLHGFLGGGATFISQIIGTEDQELKKEINKKLAELFMELEDVFGLVKKNAHPADVSLDNVGNLLEQFTKFTQSINKS